MAAPAADTPAAGISCYLHCRLRQCRQQLSAAHAAVLDVGQRFCQILHNARVVIEWKTTQKASIISTTLHSITSAAAQRGAAAPLLLRLCPAGGLAENGPQVIMAAVSRPCRPQQAGSMMVWRSAAKEQRVPCLHAM